MRLKIAVLASLLVAAVPAVAQEHYWQCAAFAREFSGLQIRADALDWWGKADGRYKRGYMPRVGAVMAFIPYGPMRLGHVATVTGIVDARDITVTHANWSPIDGTRGQIEYDVLVRDVSAAGDWSQVRVWYAPLGDLGTTAWPVEGFIYPERVDDVERAPPRDRYRLGTDVIRLARLEARAPHPFRPDDRETIFRPGR